MKTLFKMTALAIAILCMCFLIASCKASSYSDSEENDGAVNSVLIYEVEMGVRTQDVKGAYREINEKSKEYGGYIDSIDEGYSGKECSSITVVFYIPTENVEDFVDFCECKAKNVSYKDVVANKADDSYTELEERVMVLEEQKQALQALFESSEATISEKTALAEQISEVSTELVSLKNQIDKINNESRYSTVKIYINHTTTFMDVFTPILVLIIIPAALFCTIFFSIRAGKKRRRAAREKQEAEN